MKINHKEYKKVLLQNLIWKQISKLQTLKIGLGQSAFWIFSSQSKTRLILKFECPKCCLFWLLQKTKVNILMKTIETCVDFRTALLKKFWNRIILQHCCLKERKFLKLCFANRILSSEIHHIGPPDDTTAMAGNSNSGHNFFRRLSASIFD